MKTWRIVYHGPEYIEQNPEYKEGWTIATLKKIGKEGYMYDDVFSTPDDRHSVIFRGRFMAFTNDYQVIDSDPHEIIKWFFERFKK